MPDVFPILNNGTSPFPILGLLDGIFHFYSNLKRNFCKQTVESLIRLRFVASDLVLHCLPMSYKKDARLIWVKHMRQEPFLINCSASFHISYLSRILPNMCDCLECIMSPGCMK